jgi:hypothetical protein
VGWLRTWLSIANSASVVSMLFGGLNIACVQCHALCTGLPELVASAIAMVGVAVHG